MNYRHHSSWNSYHKLLGKTTIAGSEDSTEIERKAQRAEFLKRESKNTKQSSRLPGSSP